MDMLFIGGAIIIVADARARIAVDADRLEQFIA